MLGEVLSLVLASSNQGKLTELRALLQGVPVRVLSQTEALGHALTIDEDGESFADNALLKARAVSEATHLLAIADDSGLEVDALGGRPGVRSARFAHEHASDAENNAELLKQLSQVAEPQRTARFRCVVCVVSPWDGAPLFAEGSCEGSIGLVPRGAAGFGYDPLFLPRELPGRGFAELSSDEKNRISHRGQAMARLRPLLLECLNRRLDEAERALGGV